MTNNYQLLHEYLLENCVYKGDFTLTQGQQLDTYVDIKRCLGNPRQLRTIVDLLSATVESTTSAIAGMELGAVPIVANLALYVLMHYEREIPTVFVRKRVKSYGTKERFMGLFPPQAQVIVVEDVVNTGGSVLETCKLIEGAGHTVQKIITVADRQRHSQDFKQYLIDKDIRLHSLFKEWQLVKVTT